MQNTSLSDIRLIHKNKQKDVNAFIAEAKLLFRHLQKWEYDQKTDYRIQELINWAAFIGEI